MIRATIHVIHQTYRGCFTLPIVGKHSFPVWLLPIPAAMAFIAEQFQLNEYFWQTMGIQALYIVAYLAVAYCRAVNSDSKVARQARLDEFYAEMDELARAHESRPTKA